jgi:hypothetical protein
LDTLWIFFHRAAEIAAATLWPSDPATRIAIGCLAGVAIGAALSIHLPLIIRLIRLARLRDRLDVILANGEMPLQARRERMLAAMKVSPIGRVGRDFIQRWRFVELAPDADLMPARFADLVAVHPLNPRGPRRKLLESLPSLLLGVAALAIFFCLTLALSQDLTPELAMQVDQDGSSSRRIGLVLHTGLWGIALAIVATLAGRVIEGRFDAIGEALDARVMRLYEALTSRPAPLPRAADPEADPGDVDDRRSFMVAFEAAIDRLESLSSAPAAPAATGEGSTPEPLPEPQLEPQLEGIRQILEASNHFLREQQERSEQRLGEIETAIARLKIAVNDAASSVQGSSDGQTQALVERVEAVVESIARRAEAAARLRTQPLERAEIAAPVETPVPRPTATEKREHVPGSRPEPASDRGDPEPPPPSADGSGTPSRTGLSSLLRRSAEETGAPATDNEREG